MAKRFDANGNEIIGFVAADLEKPEEEPEKKPAPRKGKKKSEV